MSDTDITAAGHLHDELCRGMWEHLRGDRLLGSAGASATTRGRIHAKIAC